MQKVVIDSRPPLVKNLLFVEGFSRGGKLLLANILNGFDGVEPIQYYGLLEHLPFLEKFNLIDRKTAQEMIRCEIDTHCYEMLIGRNLNHRKFDGSTIFKIPGYKKYLLRSEEKNTDKNLKKFLRNGAYSFFMMHELMPNIKIYFETFPCLKVISIKRNPVDIAYSWHQRGLLRRFGEDPKIFMIPLKSQRGPIPWYAYKFRETFHNLSETEKIILSIKNLFAMYKKSYHKLPKKFKKKILFVSFEDLVFNRPHQIIKTVGQFLQKKPLPKMKTILTNGEVPRNSNHSLKCSVNEEKSRCTECKLAELKKVTSEKYLDILVKLKRAYEAGKTY